MRKSLNDELEDLAKRFEALVKNTAENSERQISESAKIWLESEPSFPKQIAKPLDGRPPDKLPVYLTRREAR